MSSGSAVQAACFWGPRGIALDNPGVNPYAGLLARALLGLGVHVEAVWPLDPEWLREQRGHLQVLHFHWLQGLYGGTDPEERRQRFRRFAAGLLLARRLGYRIVWTMHNLYPHEQPDPALDHRARRLICMLAHAVIVHCRHAAALLAQRFGRRHDVFVIPHGHFLDVYPNTIGRSEARRAVGLRDDAYVYLFFGVIRPYKGVERLLEVFSSLPDDRLRLVIAGRLPAGHTGPLVQKAEGGTQKADFAALQAALPSASCLLPSDERVLFRPGLVGIEDLQVYFNAADAVVLPFLETLTSGSAITALGFGRPIVVPAVGCLPELVDGRPCGVVYHPADLEGLRQALTQVRALEPAAASAAAVERARELDWGAIAGQTLRAYGLAPEARNAGQGAAGAPSPRHDTGSQSQRARGR